MVVDRGDGLDVVSCLDAHQQNLRPRTPAGRRVLLALPSPPLGPALLPSRWPSVRARWLDALARRVGLGGGPSQVWDLDRDARPLGAVLEDIEARGARCLVLAGAEDQPGLARAVRFRWPHGLIVPPRELGSSIAPLMNDTAPARWIAPDVVRILPGGVPPTEARVVLVGRVDQPDPPLALAHLDDIRTYALDQQREVAPWSGFLPPAGRFGAAGAARAAWRARWSDQSGDPVLHAALGLDEALERRLEAGGSVPSAGSGGEEPVIIAVTGIDGSGKSTQAASIARALALDGLEARVLKIYRQGAFLRLANELSGRTRRGAPLAAFRVSRLVKLADSLRVLRDVILPAGGEVDVLVMDRYLETHVAAAASQLGWDIRRHPSLRAFPDADTTCWLDLDPAVALGRIRDRREAASADEHEVGLRGYATAFRALRQSRDLVLDASDPRDPNAERLLAHVGPFLDGRRRSTGRGSVRQDWPPERDDPEPGCPVSEVVVGVVDGLPRLGADLLALRSFVMARAGTHAGAYPERFWIEAWASDVVLDLERVAGPVACLPVWPEALRRTEGMGDLIMLDELSGLLEASAERVSFEPTPVATIATFFSELGASPASSARIARAYCARVSELAAELAWPPRDGAMSAAPSAPAR